MDFDTFVTQVQQTQESACAVVTYEGLAFRVELRKTSEGWEGWVDYNNFGGGKRVLTAARKIQKRRDFLKSRSSTVTKVDHGAREAKAALQELNRRKKLWG